MLGCSDDFQLRSVLDMVQTNPAMVKKFRQGSAVTVAQTTVAISHPCIIQSSKHILDPHEMCYHWVWFIHWTVPGQIWYIPQHERSWKYIWLIYDIFGMVYETILLGHVALGQPAHIGSSLGLVPHFSCYQQTPFWMRFTNSQGLKLNPGSETILGVENFRP